LRIRKKISCVSEGRLLAAKRAGAMCHGEKEDGKGEKTEQLVKRRTLLKTTREEPDCEET